MTKINQSVDRKTSVATKRDKWFVMISLSLCLILGVTIGLNSIFRQKIDPTFDEQYQIEQNNNIINQIVDYSKNTINEKVNKTRGTLTNTENQRIDKLLLDSEIVFDSIVNNDFDNISLALVNIFNENEIGIVQSILENFSDDFEIGKQERGTFKIHLYVQFSPGYFYGYLVAGLVVAAITPIVLSMIGLGTVAGGPVGLVVGGIVGAVLGGVIQASVQNLIDRGGKADFYLSLINTSFWFLWNGKWEKNLLDYLMDLIAFGGGGWLGGQMTSLPSGYPKLQYS